MRSPELPGTTNSADWPVGVQLGAFPPELNIPMLVEDLKPVEYAEALGEAYLSYSKHSTRKSEGHYLTPAAVATFMAGQSSYCGPSMRALDPGSGTGILAAAVCEAACAGGAVKNLHVDACETDPVLASLTRLTLAFSGYWLAQRGVSLTFDVRQGDFVLEYAAALESTSEANGNRVNLGGLDHGYDLVVSNPPYFKIGKDDPRAVAWASVVHGQPNIYSLFMAISAELLSETGKLVYIVPRSFASGPYFRRFREVFFQCVFPTAVHLFESRKDVFKSQTVLQENLIIAAHRRTGQAVDSGQVLVSHSKGAHDLADRKRFVVDVDSVLNLGSENTELSIPLCAEDLELVETMRAWPNTLHSLGLEISTGPVVPFRATRFLAHDIFDSSTVPLLWMQHVRPMRIAWPAPAARKPQRIKVEPGSKKLLAPDATYVLLRRFSSKEEKRRLVAAPLIRGSLDVDVVGLENHLNYIRGVSRELDDELAYGLSALLNSTFLDRYFRISNGNTQVSATELRAMPLPAERDVRSIGMEAQARPDSVSGLTELDALVAGVLGLSPELHVGLELAAR